MVTVQGRSYGQVAATQTGTVLKTLYPKVSLLLIALAVASMAVEVLLDWTTPAQLNVSVIYSIPLILAGLARERRLLWLLLIVLLCMTFMVYVVQMRGDHIVGALVLRNRVLSAVTMLLTATLMHVWTRALDALEQRDLQIRSQNEELQRRREKTELASKQKSLLLASLSHDIRTPLHIINLTARAISAEARRLDSSGNIPTLTQQQTANAISVASLVTDILDYSAFELGHIDVHINDCAIDDVLNQLRQRLLPLAEAKQLQLIVDAPPHSLNLRTDLVKLERVLTNLVMNAIKYTDRGSVRVSAGYSDAGGVRVCVQDTGVGIPGEDRERIFDEFARLQTTAERSQSWGLGLPICRRLITLLKGTISVESQPGMGSIFIVELPLSFDGGMPGHSDNSRAVPSQSAL